MGDIPSLLTRLLPGGPSLIVESRIMRPFLTHLLAATLGMLAVLVWRAGTNGRDAATTQPKEPAGSKSHVMDAQSVSPPRDRPGDNRMSMAEQLSKPIALADLESWLASKEGDPRCYGEALVTAGLITNTPDLIRRGIEADPQNAHLLFIGSTLTAFPPEERLTMSKRLLEANPKNGLAAFLHASHLLGAGQSDAAIQMLRSSTERSQMDNFGIETQLLTDEAYAAAGLSPSAAKLRSSVTLPMSYISDLRSFVGSLKSLESSLTPDATSKLQSLTASIGHRLADQSKSGMLLNTVLGFSLEQATLDGLPDDAPSPYAGLTVAQARESILAERQAIRQEMENLPDVETIFSTDPVLMERYIDRVRLTGELEAAQWLRRETERGK